MRVACLKLMVLCCRNLGIATTHVRKQLWLLNSHHLQPHYHLSYHNLSLLSFSLKIKPVQLAIEIFLFCFFFSPSQLNLFKVIQLAIEIFFVSFSFSQLNLFSLRSIFISIYLFIFPRLGEIEPFQLAAEITLTCIHLWVSPCFSFLSRQRTWFCFSIL